MIDRLRLLVVAKDIFRSDWFRQSAERLFRDGAVADFERISEETAEEVAGVERVIDRWQRELTEGRVAREVQRATAREFLATMISLKESAGAILERVASLAPASLSEDLLELAAVDFRHANELSAILSERVPTSSALLERRSA